MERKIFKTIIITMVIFLMNTSAYCIGLIKEFEGFRSTAYICPGGEMTIGYGSVSSLTKITRKDAEILLKQKIKNCEHTIISFVNISLNQNQFDALVSFIYNIGVTAFQKSTLLKELNNRNLAGAADQFKEWRFADGKELQGLVRRRAVERELFLKDKDDAKENGKKIKQSDKEKRFNWKESRCLQIWNYAKNWLDTIKKRKKIT